MRVSFSLLWDLLPWRINPTHHFKIKKSKYHSDMSAGKHTEYKKKIVSSDGLGKPLMIGGGDGTPTSGAGPVAMLSGYWALDDGAPTLTAPQHGGVITMTTTAARAATTLTGAQLDAAFPNLPVGAHWDLHIVNLGSDALTLTAGASGVTVRGGAVASAESATFKFIKTAAETYVVSRSYGV